MLCDKATGAPAGHSAGVSAQSHWTSQDRVHVEPAPRVIHSREEREEIYLLDTLQSPMSLFIKNLIESQNFHISALHHPTPPAVTQKARFCAVQLVCCPSTEVAEEARHQNTVLYMELIIQGRNCERENRIGWKESEGASVMDSFVSPQIPMLNSVVPHNVTILGDRTFTDVIKLNESIRVDPNLV